MEIVGNAGDNYDITCAQEPISEVVLLSDAARAVQLGAEAGVRPELEPEAAALCAAVAENTYPYLEVTLDALSFLRAATEYLRSAFDTNRFPGLTSDAERTTLDKMITALRLTLTQRAGWPGTSGSADREGVD